MVSFLLNSQLMIQHSFSQEKTPIQTVKIIEESSHVLGSGLELSLTEKGEEYLHKQARLSIDWVRQVLHNNRSVYLTQELFIFKFDSNKSPTQLIRKSVLHQGVHFGKDGDEDCAVKIIQVASVHQNGSEIGSLTHHIEIPHCGKLHDLEKTFDFPLMAKGLVEFPKSPIVASEQAQIELNRIQDQYLRDQEKIRVKREEEERARIQKENERIENERIAAANEKLRQEELERQKIRDLYIKAKVELEIARKKINKVMMFPVPLEPLIGFIIDGSGSVNSRDSVSGLVYSDLAREHLSATLSLLLPTQQFVVGISDNLVFNKGKPLYATPENIAQVNAWLLATRSGGIEGFDQVLTLLKQESGRAPDRVLIFTDGEVTNSYDVTADFLKQLDGNTVVDIAPIPNSGFINIKSSGFNSDERNYNFMRIATTTTHGEILSEVHNMPDQNQINEYKALIQKVLDAAAKAMEAENAKKAEKLKSAKKKNKNR